MYLNINGRNIYYQKVGQGPNLVLLHGWGADVSTWWGITDLLKDQFTLWLIDLPGFGRSDLPKKAFSVSDYATVIAEFINKGKIRQPLLLGHSLGGRIAIKLALHYPKLINKLILVSSAGIRPKRDFAKFLIYPLAKLFHYLVPNLFGIKARLRQSFYQSLESDYLQAGPMKETLTKILKEDLTDDLTQIHHETLLIWGENDPTQEASLNNGKKMYRLIKNSRLEVLEQVGHFPHLEAPEQFAYWIKNFALIN